MSEAILSGQNRPPFGLSYMKCEMNKFNHGEERTLSLPQGWPDEAQKPLTALAELCLSFGLFVQQLEPDLDTAGNQHSIVCQPQQQYATIPLNWPEQGPVLLHIAPLSLHGTPFNHQTLRGIQNSLQQLLNMHTALAASQQQADRWQQALYSSFAVWDWDRTTQQLFCSQEWTNLLGLPHNTIRSVRSLLQRIHPNDRGQFITSLRKLESGTIDMLDCEVRFRHAWEDYIWLRTRGKASGTFANGKAQRIIGTSVNITARKNAEEEIYDLCQQLHNSELLYRELMKHASDAILIVDTLSGKIIDANHLASHLSSYTLKELMGMERSALLKTPQGDCIPCQGKGLIRDMRLVGKYGQEHIIDISCTSINVSGQQLAQCIIHDISEHKAIEARLHHLAHHDPLTGLPNRILFRDRLQHAIRKAQRNNTLLALCFFDLDRFKSINDSLGHDIGDQVLITIAERLSSSIRASDTAARLAGDEFVIILEELDQAEMVQTIASKILKRINQPITIGTHQIRVTSSLGISIYPHFTRDSDTLLSQADTAMYRAKTTGNCLEFYAFSEDEGQKNLDLWPQQKSRST